MNGKAMSPTAKVIESQLRQKFKDIERYLDFFEKSIEAEKGRAAKASLKYEDEMFRHIATYQSHISFPAIHCKALLIFMHSSFEHMLCWTACWIAIGEDGGNKIGSLKGYSESIKYLEKALAGGRPFESPEWKSVEELRLVRNHLAHGGSENILGVGEQDKHLLAAREVNGKFDGAFDITESEGRFTIEPNQRTVRIAMARYRDFLYLLAKLAKGECKLA